MNLYTTTLLHIDGMLRDAYKMLPELFTEEHEHLIDELELGDPNPDIKLPYLLSEIDSHAFGALSDTNKLDFENLEPNDYKVTINLDDEDPTSIFYDYANKVMDEYDSGLPTEEWVTWEEYGLGGDDDVDYNGSYIMTLMDAIKFYLTLLLKK